MLVVATLLASGCGGGGSGGPSDPPPANTRDSRLSASVALVYSSAEMQDFLAQPAQGYVEAYFSFPDTLASDVWFGIDQEHIEGVDAPLMFAGADWMGFFAVNRAGQIATPVGSAASHAGTPDDGDDWVIDDTGVTLAPDTWYRLRGEVDFNTRTFSRVTLEGPAVTVTIDYIGRLLSYPNYASFDKPFMSYYVFALRAAEFAQPGSTVVYFDDVEAGIVTAGGTVVVFSDGFENQAAFDDIPVATPVIARDDVTEFRWYKERDEALIRAANERQRTGNFSLAADARLTD